MKQLRLVVGLTGLPGSGKGEVAAALCAAAERRGMRGERLVFSDQIKDEARRRGYSDSAFTRELLAGIGTELREKNGPGALAGIIASKIHASNQPRAELFIADGLRHVGEEEALRKAFGEDFFLVAVEAEPREIAKRLIARRRPDESRAALESEEKAIALLEEELKGTISSMGPNVSKCIERADMRLPNHGTLQDLKRAADTLFQRLIAAQV